MMIDMAKRPNTKRNRKTSGRSSARGAPRRSKALEALQTVTDVAETVLGAVKRISDRRTAARTARGAKPRKASSAKSSSSSTRGASKSARRR